MRTETALRRVKPDSQKDHTVVPGRERNLTSRRPRDEWPRCCNRLVHVLRPTVTYPKTIRLHHPSEVRLFRESTAAFSGRIFGSRVACRLRRGPERDDTTVCNGVAPFSAAGCEPKPGWAEVVEMKTEAP